LPIRAEPFSDPAWLFELKYDGFRALAHISNGDCTLISRNGNAFRSFESLRAAIPGDLTPQQAVIDGEIVCLDAQGRSRFTDLLFRRGEPCFVAFVLDMGAETGDTPELHCLHRGRTWLQFLSMCPLDSYAACGLTGVGPVAFAASFAEKTILMCAQSYANSLPQSRHTT
jgi:hypothetical protein